MGSERASEGRWSKTIGYYGAFIAFGITGAALGPALPGLARNTQSSLSAISILFTTQSLGYLLGVTLGGRAFDRVAGHPVMTGSLIAAAVAAASIPAIPALWPLGILALVLGMASGVVEVGANTLLIWVHRQGVEPWMNGLHFCFGFGAFLAPLIITQVIAATQALTWAFWILAAIILLPVAGILRLPSPAIRGSPGSDQTNGIDPTLVIPLALLFLLYIGAEVGFGGWIFTYTATLHPGAEATAGYLTSAFWGALTVGRLLAIPSSTRLAPSTVLAADLAGCVLGVGLILIWPASIAAVWIGTSGTGLAMASIFPTLMSFAERGMQLSGRVNGWRFAGAGLGGMSLPWLIGQLFETTGPKATMVTLLVDLLVASGVFLGLVLLTRSHSRGTAA